MATLFPLVAPRQLNSGVREVLLRLGVAAAARGGCWDRKSGCGGGCGGVGLWRHSGTLWGTLTYGTSAL